MFLAHSRSSSLKLAFLRAHISCYYFFFFCELISVIFFASSYQLLFFFLRAHISCYFQTHPRRMKSKKVTLPNPTPKYSVRLVACLLFPDNWDHDKKQLFIQVLNGWKNKQPVFPWHVLKVIALWLPETFKLLSLFIIMHPCHLGMHIAIDS